MYWIKNKDGVSRFATSSCPQAMGYYEYTKKHEGGYAELWIDDTKVLSTYDKNKIAE